MSWDFVPSGRTNIHCGRQTSEEILLVISREAVEFELSDAPVLILRANANVQ